MRGSHFLVPKREMPRSGPELHSSDPRVLVPRVNAVWVSEGSPGHLNPAFRGLPDKPAGARRI